MYKIYIGINCYAAVHIINAKRYLGLSNENSDTVDKFRIQFD